jgi:hypothetical protein
MRHQLCSVSRDQALVRYIGENKIEEEEEVVDRFMKINQDARSQRLNVKATVMSPKSLLGKDFGECVGYAKPLLGSELNNGQSCPPSHNQNGR